MRLVFDLEADGFLDEATQLHMIIIGDCETREVSAYTDHPDLIRDSALPPSGSIAEGLKILRNADETFAFNSWGYDIPLLAKLYPDFHLAGEHKDLMVEGTLMMPYDILVAQDQRQAQKGKFPTNLIGSESLRAWAIRAGEEQKADFNGPWDTLSVAMWEYGIQDGHTTLSVCDYIMGKRRSKRASWIEQNIARITQSASRNGWAVDLPYLRELDATLADVLQKKTNQLVGAFGSWYAVDKPKADHKLGLVNGKWVARGRKASGGSLVKIPKRSAVRNGVEYTKGRPYTPITLHKFNPSARQDIYRGLNRKYGWEPHKRTDGGQPKVSEETLAAVSWPEAELAREVLHTERIRGFTRAWLQLEKDGRIHGRIFPNRANTRRMTHAQPNMAQVPSSSVEWGKECRACFVADPTPGWVVVGCDAAQLELRCLANRLHPYDNGKYGDIVIHGDVHMMYASEITGLDASAVTPEQRQEMKTVTYAWLYGAGDRMLEQAYRSVPNVPKLKGKEIRTRYETRVEGVVELLEQLKTEATQYKALRSLDGHWLSVRKQHALLNLLLQSDGALVMKVAQIHAHKFVEDAGLSEGQDWKWLGTIHDEYQATTRQDNAPVLGSCFVRGIVEAGEFFNLPIRLDGEFKVGRSWAETH